MDTVVSTRHRHWRHKFLDGLEHHGIVSLAAQEAGIERRTAYYLRESDPAFAEEWKAALDRGVDMLEDVAKKRAYEGSDLLLIFLLKAHRPAVYREINKTVQVNITPEQVERMSDDELDRLIDSLRTGPR